MKRVLCLLTLLPLRHASTPLLKVVEMLEEMKTHGEKEKQEEAVQFAAYKQFCENTELEKKRVIANAKDSLEALGAVVEKTDSDVTRLAAEIAEVLRDSATATLEAENSTALRNTERQSFEVMLKDYSESVDAIGRALRELRGKKQEGVLVQMSSLQLPAKASRGLQSLLSQGFEDELLSELGEPKLQSGGVVQMLEKLLEQFVDERLQLEKEETAKKHAFQLLSESLKHKLEQAKKEEQQKQSAKAKKLQEKAAAASEAGETKSSLRTDEDYLKELLETCGQKARDFESRQKLREEELVAIGEARKVIQQMSGSQLLQATSLAHLRSLNPVQAEVARFLQRQASKVNSRVLSAIAERAEADPTAKVKKMIEQLITRLADQAREETTKQAWCDAEMSSNKATLEEKGDRVSSLQAEMDKLQAAMSKLDEESSQLAEELQDLDSAAAKASELRERERASNEASLVEAEKGQEAVAKAVMTLKDFYAKAGASFVETKRELRDAPAVFENKAYKGQGPEGVLSMLEVIEADLSRMEAESKSAEAAAKKEHDAFMEESKITKAQKSKDLEHKKSKKQEMRSESVNLKADLQGTQKELTAAETYLEKLKPDCLDTGASYLERKAKREQELKDLKEALEMLSA